MFNDVPKDAWYAKDVEEAARYGLMNGVAPGQFNPNGFLTRAQAAALTVRLFKATNEDFVEIIDSVLPSIVQIENDYMGSLGSGTIIHEDGYILTNAHVVCMLDHNGDFIIGSDGKPSLPSGWMGFRSPDRIFGSDYAMGPIVAVDIHRDLALCKALVGDTKLHPLPIEKERPKISSKVLAIGSPLGLIRSVTEGVVSEYRTLNKPNNPTVLQIDAPINPGNSGGALVNLEGKLVGVPTLKMSAVGIEGLGFAIDIPTVLAFFEEHNIPFEI